MSGVTKQSDIKQRPIDKTNLKQKGLRTEAEYGRSMSRTTGPAPAVSMSRMGGHGKAPRIAASPSVKAGAAMSRTGSVIRSKSIRVKSMAGVDSAAVPPRKLRREAAEEFIYQNRNKLKEIEAGQIWDFWAVKLNAYISDSQNHQASAMDRITDSIWGRPKLSEKKEMELQKEERERLQRLEKARAQQRKVLVAAQTVLFGPPKSQEELDEEIKQCEEEELQLEQLARLEELFEGTLTLL